MVRRAARPSARAVAGGRLEPRMSLRTLTDSAGVPIAPRERSGSGPSDGPEPSERSPRSALAFGELSDPSPISAAVWADPSDLRQFSHQFARTLGPLPDLRRCVGRPLGPFVNSPSSFREPSDRSPISAAVGSDPSDRSQESPGTSTNPPTVHPISPGTSTNPRRVPREALPRGTDPVGRSTRRRRASGQPSDPSPTVPGIFDPRSDRSPKPPRTFRNPPTPPLELPRSFRTLSTVRPSRHGFRGPLPPLLPRALGAVRSLRERWRPAHRTRGGASMSPAPPPERRRLRDPRVVRASGMRHRVQRAPGPMLGPADAALSSQAHDRAARGGWRGVGAGSTPAARGSGQTGIGRAERPILESLWSTESIWRTEKARRATWSSLGSGRRGDAEDSPMRHGPRMGRVRPASSADSNESVL